eukprot:TRINITY_DN15661_c0_g1_i1.p1 TRINITY_DN15661_c0_g1~~TRINITY_DN15661_c0_g1_i1.p1  ORF type:complete len:396 (+),score=126.22 TRINITY_DN15661_c0_g1_i1:24-1211(+)
MAEVKDDPSATHLLEDLFAKYSDAVKELRGILEELQLLDALKNEDEELVLMRYALGFRGNVDQAKDGLVAAMERRLKFNVPELKSIESEAELLENVPHMKRIQEYLPSKFFQPGPEMHNVTYRFVGLANVAKIFAEITLDEWEEATVTRLGLQMRYLNKRSRETGKLAQICTVLDLEGLTQSKMSFFEYFKRESLVGQSMAPECLKFAVVVHTPWFFNMLYKLVSNLLNPRTIAKAVILGSGKNEITQALTEKFGSEDKVPQRYGGTMDSSSWEKMLNPLAGFEQQTILAGAVFQKEYKIEEAGHGIEILWRLQAKDIEFGAIFNDGTREEEFLPVNKESPIDETFVTHFTAPGPGTVIVTWNNKASYWNSKTIWFQVNVQTIKKFMTSNPSSPI